MRGFINLTQPVASPTSAVASSCHLSCDLPTPETRLARDLLLCCQLGVKDKRPPGSWAEEPSGGGPMPPLSLCRGCESSFLCKSVPPNVRTQQQPQEQVTPKQTTCWWHSTDTISASKSKCQMCRKPHILFSLTPYLQLQNRS